MLKRIICAGVGGQGALTLGNILAEAAASQGKFVTWVPEYGSEMRGGNASCKVKIGDEAIISPFMEEMDILVALHTKPMEKYAAGVEKGGVIIVESDIVKDIPEYSGRTVIKVPATTLANEIENPKGMSVAMAGALIACSDLFPLETATEAVEKYFAEKKLPVEKNKATFIAGYQYVKNQ